MPRVLALLTGLTAEVRGPAWIGQRQLLLVWQTDPLSPLPTLQLKGSPSSQEGHGTQLENVALHALLLCEELFDPYQTWRRQHSG